MYGFFSSETMESAFPDDTLSVEKDDVSSRSASCIVYDDSVGYSVVTANAGARTAGDGAKMAKRVSDLTGSGTEVNVSGLDQFDAARVTRDESGSRVKYHVGVATEGYLIHLIFTPVSTDPADAEGAIVDLIRDADANLDDLIASDAEQTTSSGAVTGMGAVGQASDDVVLDPSKLSSRLG